jgi:hypothetical protein
MNEHCTICDEYIVESRHVKGEWYHGRTSSTFCDPVEGFLNMHTADRATPPTYIIQEAMF